MYVDISKYDTTLSKIDDKIDKFCYFESDIDYTSKADVFRDVIYPIITQCESRSLKGASGGQFVSASPTAQASEAHLCKSKLHCQVQTWINIRIIKKGLMLSLLKLLLGEDL